MAHQTSSMTPCAPALARVANCLPSSSALWEGACMKEVSCPACALRPVGTGNKENAQDIAGKIHMRSSGAVTLYHRLCLSRALCHA